MPLFFGGYPHIDANIPFPFCLFCLPAQEPIQSLPLFFFAVCHHHSPFFLMWDVRNAGRNGGVIGAAHPQSSEKDARKRDCLPYTVATPCGNTFPMLAKQPDSLFQRSRFAYCRGKNSKKSRSQKKYRNHAHGLDFLCKRLMPQAENPQKNIWLNMFNPAGQS